MFENLRSHLTAAGIVHYYYPNSSAPDCADAKDVHAFENKVLRPAIAPWVEQRHDLLSPRINPRKIRALMQIRAVARQCEIIRIIGAAVLSRDDVLNMMDQSAMFLLQPAVFATLASPPPNEVPRRRIHLPLNV